MSSVIESLQQIISKKNPELNFSELNLDDSVQALGIDSLDFVELIYDIEQHFQIEFHPEDLGKITSIRDLINISEQLVPAQ